MAEIVKITKGQPFVLYVPLVILNGDGSKEAVEAASLSAVTVKMLSACEESSATYNTFERYLVLDLPETLNTGVYAVVITATLPQGRQFALRIKRAFEVVDWDSQSNWRDYLVGDHIELTDQPFIAGVFATDADIERLKEELRQQKEAAAQAQAAAEAAKEEYDRKAEALDDVAKQSTLTHGVADIRNDISTLAKETTAEAAKQAALDAKTAAQALSPVALAAEAYNTGKPELAANITAKGVPASATETLPELAAKVRDIAQTTTEIVGGEMYGAQLFGDANPAQSPLWNLYDVLAEMKTRFMGAGQYAALIVCEYYKGYDSLQLQGADAYYTCDGDFYDTSAPLHVWHDNDNGRTNRWVCFLFATAGARLDITNTAISPRSMYIGGHIGTIEYFVNGRLTDLVCGVEETDYVDYFLQGGFTQSYGFNTVMRGVKHLITSSINITALVTTSAGTVILNDLEDIDATSLNTSNYDRGLIYAKSAQFVIIEGAKYCKLINSNIINAGTSIVGIEAQDIETLSAKYFALFYDNSGNAITLQYIDLRNLKSASLGGLFYGWTGLLCKNLIDVWVGAMETNLYIGSSWNPTNVLADATKKAQLIDNIKNHILARVSDATGGTQLVFTVSTNMYNNIASETIEWQGETMTLADAFLTKNWLLAGA